MKLLLKITIMNHQSSNTNTDCLTFFVSHPSSCQHLHKHSRTTSEHSPPTLLVQSSCYQVVEEVGIVVGKGVGEEGQKDGEEGLQEKDVQVGGVLLWTTVHETQEGVDSCGGCEGSG